MSRDVHVRNCEGLSGKFRWPTRRIVHCRSKHEAEKLFSAIRERLSQFKLELNPDKTKIVYCKDYRRKEEYEIQSFNFLGFSFQPRILIGKDGNRLLGYKPGISQDARLSIRNAIREVISRKRYCRPIEWLANSINAKLRGWINYYGKFMRRETLTVFRYVNFKLIKSIMDVHKISKKWAYVKLQEIQKETPKMFYHWLCGVYN